jgi:hypothetical protein
MSPTDKPLTSATISKASNLNSQIKHRLRLERRKTNRFAVGHLALGYILSAGSAKLTKTNFNIPAVLVLSIIPDVDLLFPFIGHRGPMHSVVVMLAVFIPFFAVYGKKAVPYFVALVQHALIGDAITGGGVQLLWPLTTRLYGAGIPIRSQTNVGIEWIAFLAAVIIMFKTRDITKFFEAHKSNLLLAIPTFTTLLPTLASFPLGVPLWLVPPHIFYTIIFSAAIILAVSAFLKEP